MSKLPHREEIDAVLQHRGPLGGRLPAGLIDVGELKPQFLENKSRCKHPSAPDEHGGVEHVPRRVGDMQS